ncbi:family 16 glycoside hydrolase [Mucilaginibacter roseus]|uniref:family 16 glycoside hydrolase n=1 Tax=Mucilaginibacter roseus TaxID=1528868 RepID=UPI00293E7E04|nr:family 16 glycoside hydrolase [Mucilaginibacter roseus]
MLAQQAHIKVDASKVLNRIPEKLYGSCIEDVNHEIYGGLYDQRIFGESFEEPALGPQITGWQALGGHWKSDQNEIQVNAGEGFKLVRNKRPVGAYTVSLQLKFGSRNDNAGILVNVNNARTGADRFNGYEISIDPNKRVLVFGKHQNNWTPLQEVKTDIDFKAWIKLKVKVDNNHFTVYINDKNEPIADLTDHNNPLPSGHFALRTYNADVTYKQIAFNNVIEKFTSKTQLQVSGAWDVVNTANNAGYALVTDAYNGSQAQLIMHNGGKGLTGIANRGLNRWGIAIKKGNTYTGELYLKAQGIKDGATVSLQSADGRKMYASHTIKSVTSKWAPYSFRLKSNQTDGNARFVVTINSKGKLLVDQATLICKQEQFKGLRIRNDIAQTMQQEGLNFLRYGGTMVNAEGYRFKKMIGLRQNRPPYKGHWYPYSTNGFGIEDFLQFCEAAGFEAAFAVNIEETPEDMADMVEYLKGSINTKWGKLRAQNGHPVPYKVKYIEIGNEEVIFQGDVAADYEHYAERFVKLRDAMHAKDSTIKFICSAWWRPNSPNMKRVFRAINGKADYWDLHTDADAPNSGSKVDSSLTQMKVLFLKWDPNTRLKCAIFEENGGRHDVARALGHATTLNAVRRHGDFVLTSCAANALQPLGQNDNGWDQGQIFFTPSQVWGMPPFYAQQMASANHQPLNYKQ